MGNQKQKLIIGLLLLTLLCFIPAAKVNATTAKAISFGTINYELLTMQVYNNNNSIVYYSTDNSTWTELEAAYDNTTSSYTMDISWVSTTSDVTLYFKGNTVKTVKTIVLPAQNSIIKVTYDKSEGTFTFINAEEADSFEWRKSTDYNWISVDMDETSTSYNEFLDTMEYLRITGASIIIRIPQQIGIGSDDVGIRQSAEVTVTVTARGTAPTVKVNSSKLTVNTTTAMEYYDTTSALWVECTGTMSLSDVTPKVLYSNGAVATTLMLRKAASTSTPYSKTQYLSIPAQAAAPTIGDSSKNVTYYYMNSKLVLQFNNASSTNIYEYTIIKSGYDYDVTTASWKSVKTTNILTLSRTTAPEGCTIYVRKKGTDENTTTSKVLVLSSAENSIIVNY
ncbi:MAG: hypothetical protein PHF63_02440 [Herbinix sp.]|nr:hypothetical protein [Herbinix sp.]